jgi:hypothetical protein
MAFVKRDETGSIVAVYARAEAGAQEDLPADDPELIRFLTSVSGGGDAWESLYRSDLAMGRVLEDLIQVLIDKRVIMATDLPREALEKLGRRQSLREKMHSRSGFSSDDSDAII